MIKPHFYFSTMETNEYKYKCEAEIEYNGHYLSSTHCSYIRGNGNDVMCCKRNHSQHY